MARKHATSGGWFIRNHIPMKSDAGRRGFVSVFRMTFLFDTAILNIELKWKI
jgi:hypothetical protein